MTTCESARNALEAAHSFMWEEMIIPKVPEDGDYDNRDRYLRRYVRTLETIEDAVRRLDPKMDPEKEMCLLGKYGDDPSPCPCCGGNAVAESGDGRYGWWAQVRCATCGLMLHDSENPKNPAYDRDMCLATLVGKWNNRVVRTCRVEMRRSDSDYTDEPRYVCSECGGFIPVNERDPETKAPVDTSRFCPNCGRFVVVVAGASPKGATDDDGREDNGGTP